MNTKQQKINEEVVDLLRGLTTDMAWIKNEIEGIKKRLKNLEDEVFKRHIQS